MLISSERTERSSYQRSYIGDLYENQTATKKNGNAILCFISKPNWSFDQFERYPTVTLFDIFVYFEKKKYT